jgi:hypothetical protein
MGNSETSMTGFTAETSMLLYKPMSILISSSLKRRRKGKFLI